MSTRGFIERSCSFQPKSYAAATGRKPREKLSADTGAGAENDTRMKKRMLSGSPYWALSTMLQSCDAMQVATAATMPRRSPQERVRTKRAGSAGMAGVDVRFPMRGDT